MRNVTGTPYFSVMVVVNKEEEKPSLTPEDMIEQIKAKKRNSSN